MDFGARHIGTGAIFSVLGESWAGD